MVPSAPRYPAVFGVLVRELDDPAAPMAETCRRVGSRAQQLGYVRPSLAHLRGLVRAERERRAIRDARQQLIAEVRRHVVRQVMAAQAPNARWMIDQLEAIELLGAHLRES